MYDFITHTWNTIKGECPHGCSYCYMKRWGKQPPLHFDEKELKTDLGKNNFIFVGSSCDMFAESIPDEWIIKTLDHCKKYSENNYFLALKELKIHGDLYNRRTDIVGFVNGIPLLFIELKKNTVDVQEAYDNNYTDYLDTIPHLFYYNSFILLSNGTEAKIGTLGNKFEYFHEWKRLTEDDQGSVALETMLRGICKKETFLDLFENFILYDHSNGHTTKILARNHQYLGVNEAIKAYENRQYNDGKLGVFWHTQGSGKSYSMLFFAKKIRRQLEGTPTFIVLTDREELNKQISDTFENCGLLGKNLKAQQFP